MRITTSQLRRIIKEEARRAMLNEALEGRTRSDLVAALNDFKQSYEELEGMLQGFKRQGEISSTDVIQAAQEQCGSATGAVTSMEVFKTWKW